MLPGAAACHRDGATAAKPPAASVKGTRRPKTAEGRDYSECVRGAGGKKALAGSESSSCCSGRATTGELANFGGRGVVSRSQAGGPVFSDSAMETG